MNGFDSGSISTMKSQVIRLSDVSIIILCIDFFLKLLEGGKVNQSVFEGNCNIIVVSEKLHNKFLSASLESRNVFELETQIFFVDLRPSLILLFSN